MTIVIVQGVFTVKPEERDQFLEASVAGIRSSRKEDGCQEYVIAADPVDPGRLVLSERWESIEHLQQHVKNARSQREGSEPDPEARPAPISQEITVYEIAGTRPLG